MEMRIPPRNIEAEQSVLSSILVNQNMLNDVIGDLSPKDFYDSRHQILYDAMIRMYQDELDIDPVTLSNFIKPRIEEAGGIKYISQLFSSGIPVNIKSYADIIKEKSVKRQIANIGLGMYNAAFEDEKASREILNTAEDRIYNLSESKSDEPATITESLVSTMDLIEKNYKKGGGITGMSTGFTDIDNMINGLNKGDFIIIAGRPSMGKTALAINIADNVSVKNDTLFFTLEMSKEQLVQRILSSETLIRHKKIKQGRLLDEDFLKLANVSGQISTRKIFIDETSVTTINQIKAKSKKMKIKHGLDIVIIDYLGIIENSEKGENRERELSKMSRQLKNMAKELGIAVIALSQLNRAPEARANKRPQLSDLRESGGIEQDADIVIMLYRDDYYDPNSDKKGITECIIAKNRDGEVGVAELGWLGEFQRFANLERFKKE